MQLPEVAVPPERGRPGRAVAAKVMGISPKCWGDHGDMTI